MSDFSDYLKAQNKSNVRQILCYARKYASILETGDASPLFLTKSAAVKRHGMESLTILTKYAGCHDRWRDIRKRYSLHWNNGNKSLQAMERFFNPNLSLDSMLFKVKEMMRVLPANMAVIIRFNCLTGLRPSEAVESVRLLNDVKDTSIVRSYHQGYGNFTPYYNPSQQCLEHFRFPDVFLRPTKPS